MLGLQLTLIPFLFLVSESEIPPIDTKFISQVRTNARGYTVAERAVRACKDTPVRKRVRKNFRDAGFGVSIQEVRAKNESTVSKTIISAPNGAITILYFDNSCYVALENMTPGQSDRLAQIWVDEYQAQPNSTHEDS